MFPKYSMSVKPVLCFADGLLRILTGMLRFQWLRLYLAIGEPVRLPRRFANAQCQHERSKRTGWIEDQTRFSIGGDAIDGESKYDPFLQRAWPKHIVLALFDRLEFSLVESQEVVAILGKLNGKYLSLQNSFLARCLQQNHYAIGLVLRAVVIAALQVDANHADGNGDDQQHDHDLYQGKT